MFFRHFFLLALIGLASLLFAKEKIKEDINDQKRQVYMLKGQLYEQEQKLELEKLVKEKNGFFIGGILGNVTIHLDAKDGASHPLLYGVRAGYQKYLNNYVAGLRFYAEYLRGDEFGSDEGNVIIHHLAYQIGSVNLDLLADVPLDKDKKFSLGLFAGAGMGWLGYKNKDLKININQLGMVVNLGIALTLNIKHRIEVSLKIPPIKVKGSPSNGLDSSNLYLVSYNFLF